MRGEACSHLPFAAWWGSRPLLTGAVDLEQHDNPMLINFPVIISTHRPPEPRRHAADAPPRADDVRAPGQPDTDSTSKDSDEGGTMAETSPNDVIARYGNFYRGDDDLFAHCLVRRRGRSCRSGL